MTTQNEETAGQLWNRAFELVFKAQNDLAAAGQVADPRHCLNQAKVRASALGQVLSELLHRVGKGERL